MESNRANFNSKLTSFVPGKIQGIPKCLRLIGKCWQFIRICDAVCKEGCWDVGLDWKGGADVLEIEYLTVSDSISITSDLPREVFLSILFLKGVEKELGTFCSGGGVQPIKYRNLSVLFLARVSPTLQCILSYRYIFAPKRSTFFFTGLLEFAYVPTCR